MVRTQICRYRGMRAPINGQAMLVRRRLCTFFVLLFIITGQMSTSFRHYRILHDPFNNSFMHLSCFSHRADYRIINARTFYEMCKLREIICLRKPVCNCIALHLQFRFLDTRNRFSQIYVNLIRYIQELFLLRISLFFNFCCFVKKKYHIYYLDMS